MLKNTFLLAVLIAVAASFSSCNQQSGPFDFGGTINVGPGTGSFDFNAYPSGIDAYMQYNYAGYTFEVSVTQDSATNEVTYLATLSDGTQVFFDINGSFLYTTPTIPTPPTAGKTHHRDSNILVLWESLKAHLFISPCMLLLFLFL